MQARKTFESQLTQLSLIASVPLFLLLVWVMIYAGISTPLVLLTILFSLITIIYCHTKIHQVSAYQFRSLCNLLDAMIQGDYSLRARSSEGDAALNELIDSINGLAIRLNKQRIESVESQLLLKTVINHIDVAIIALNDSNELVLSNPAANALFQLPEIKKDSELLHQLKQFEPLVCGENTVMTLKFGEQQGKFNVHMEQFREQGQQQKLLFITDVSVLLRIEERNAWQSLVRVISHEINNSLAPIASISETLRRLLSKQQDIYQHKDNLVEGLSIIAQRTNNLKDFVNSYKQIAHLPVPQKKITLMAELIKKIASLYVENNITVRQQADISLFIDPVQIEQVMINLVKNAVESAQNNPVEISWKTQNNRFYLYIKDEGLGIANPDNLFVPFYTTKKKGSGIGLVLCRQILEAHGGQLTLVNRDDCQGCLATVVLPVTI